MINYFRDRPERVRKLDVLAGFKTPSAVICSGDIQSCEQCFNTIITVDDACVPWSGCEGLVTNFIPDLEIGDPESTHAVVVGPPVMLRFAVQELLKKGLFEDRIWISLERSMHCGLGKCGHCRIEDR